MSEHGNIINSRYRILQKLGEGGMGSVYLACDLLKNNKKITIKLIHSSKIYCERIEQFKYEFAVRSRIKHPNLASVHDFGIMEGSQPNQLYYTGDYFDGTSLLDVFNNSITESETLSLLVQIARILQFIHSKGIIHYDVKPSNILVRKNISDGFIVKLIDFGLVKEIAPGYGTTIRGSIPYVAPEIIKGGSVDHRADLYSLGISMYEVISGTRPFEASDPLTLLRKHVEEKPRPIVSSRFEVSANLQQVVMKLLEKDPADRYFCANDIIREINGFRNENYPLETRSTRKSYLIPIRLIGRVAEYSRLLTAFDALVSPIESPVDISSLKSDLRPMLIRGVAGIGKTRLVNELKIHVQLRGIPFILGQCGGNSSSMYDPVFSCIRHIVSVLDSLATASGNHTRIDRIFELKTRPIGKLESEFRKNEQFLDFNELDPRSFHLSRLNEISDFFIDASKLCPMVFCFEDLHQAGHETLRAVIHLLKKFQSQSKKNTTSNNYPRLLIVITSRPVLSDGSTLDEILQLNTREPLAQIIDLKQFCSEETDEYLTGVLGKSNVKQSALTRKIDRIARGNPLFIQSVLKDLIDKKIILFDRITWSIKPHLLKKYRMESDVTDLMKRQIAQLSARSGTIMRIMSVFDRDVSIEDLIQISRLGHLEIYAELEDLVRKNLILCQHSEKGNRYAMVHEILQKSISTHLKRNHRKALHRKIAEYLETKGFGLSGDNAGELAWHYTEAGDREKAFLYSCRAADHSIQKINLEDAASHLHNAINQFVMQEDPRQWGIELKLSTVLNKAGKRGEAAPILERMYRNRNGKPDRDVTCVMLNLAKLSLFKGNFEGIETLLKQAESLIKKNGFRHELIQMLAIRLKLLRCQGDLNGALKFYKENKPLILSYASDCPYSWAFLNSASEMLFNELYMGDHHQLEEAEALTLNALTIAKSQRNRSGELTCYCRLGTIHGKWMNKEKQYGFYCKALEIARELGDRLSECTCMMNMETCRLDQDYDSAIRHMTEIMEIAAECGEESLQAIIQWNIGIDYAFKGEAEIAMEYLRDAVARYQKAGHKERAARVYFSMGMAYELADQYDAALVFYTNSQNMFKDLNLEAHELYAAIACVSVLRMNDCFAQSFERNQTICHRAIEMKDLNLEISARLQNALLYGLLDADILAKDEYERILEFAVTQSDHSLEWQCRLGLAELHFLQGEYDRADQLIHEADRLVHHCDLRQTGLRYHILCPVYATWGDSNTAGCWVKEEAHYVRTVYPGTRRLIARNLYHASLVQQDIDLTKALDLLSHALDILEPIRNDKLTCIVLLRRAAIYLSLEILDLLRNDLTKCEAVVKQSKFPALLAEWKYLECAAEFRERNLLSESLEAELLETKQLLANCPRPELELKIHFLLGNHYERADKIDDALQHYQQSYTQLKKLTQSIPAKNKASYLSTGGRKDIIEHIKDYSIRHIGIDLNSNSGWSEIPDPVSLNFKTGKVCFSDSDLQYMSAFIDMMKIMKSSGDSMNTFCRAVLMKMIELADAERGMICLHNVAGEPAVRHVFKRSGESIENASLPDPNDADSDLYPGVCVRLESGHHNLGVLYLEKDRTTGKFEKKDRNLIKNLCQYVSVLIANSNRTDEKYKQDQLQRVELETELSLLMDQLSSQKTIIGNSPAFRKTMQQSLKASRADSAVVIEGESGTGKESFAYWIHKSSGRSHKPFFIINCMAIPPHLLEAELFGAETDICHGKSSLKTGRFELADGGSVLLDEIGDFPPEILNKILKMIEDKTIRPLGCDRTIQADVRILVSTTRDREDSAKSGGFDKEFFSRLSAVCIKVPPLRDRGEDILMIADHFLNQFRQEHRKEIHGFTDKAKHWMMEHTWPGNITEMKHRIQRAVILCFGDLIDEQSIELCETGNTLMKIMPDR